MQYTIYLLMMITIGWFFLLKLCGCLPSCGSPFLLILSLHLHPSVSLSLTLKHTMPVCVTCTRNFSVRYTHPHPMSRSKNTHSLSIAFILTRKRGLSRSLLNHSSSTQSHSLSPSLSFPLSVTVFCFKR